ncbi:MAG: tRNA epoxyqueuosine(34) reductase QueG [Gammaproteobacteria bacterium]
MSQPDSENADPTQGGRPGTSAPTSLASDIVDWGKALGFQEVGICGVDLGQAEEDLLRWLKLGFHGSMDWMERHGTLRSRPADLEVGTLSVISARMDYWPADAVAPWPVISDPGRAYISRYALGRDYHKVLRKRLQQLANRIEQAVRPLRYRVFTDSAPVLEKPVAALAGLGWQGKHTNLINERAGSWFFLGEIYTDLPLEPSRPTTDHCGSCSACMAACPTGAIIAPYQLDARLCISYLTIEHAGAIAEDLRPALGNRIYGCDDCQLVCPWNKFAAPTSEPDFQVRNGLDNATLVDLSQWHEQDFLDRFAGTAIRRIGHERWQRNIAVALGNARRALTHDDIREVAIRQALERLATSGSALVAEHAQWGLGQAGKPPKNPAS